jgi:hypothetical protein
LSTHLGKLSSAHSHYHSGKIYLQRVGVKN